MNLLQFLITSPRFLAFGFLTAFFSSFGQTYFIALSGAEIRTTFDLSHGDFGGIYSVGTLSSAVLLIWAGRKIDDVDLRLYTLLVCIGMAAACFGMSAVSSAIWLFPVIFGLRFTGQGLMSHIATVGMARYFDAHRGKAISVAAMGYPAAEAVFPFIAVSLIALIGWREMWMIIGIVMVIGITPLILWLLKGHGERHRRLMEETLRSDSGRDTSGWTRAQMLRDPRFYILAPAILAPSFIGTGFLFHQVHLVDVKGWTLSWFAGVFVIFAIGQTTAALSTGILVDRFSALRLMRFELLPLAAGLIVLSLFSDPWVAGVFMVALGVTSGISAVTHGAVWAEIYGVTHLGAIKAMGTSLMVLASALSPPAMGWAIDAGVTMEAIAVVCAVYCCAAAILVAFVNPRPK